MNGCYSVHASLPTTTVWVNENILYNADVAPEDSMWVKGKLFGITCLAGNVPVFDVLIDNQYVFSDIPPHMIWLSETRIDTCPTLTLSDLVYNNCLSDHFALVQYPELERRPSQVYVKGRDLYVPAQYWFSLDFYRDNNWFHCMKLANGQLAFVPSHKIVFRDSGEPVTQSHTFPTYKKLRLTFRV